MRLALFVVLPSLAGREGVMQDLYNDGSLKELLSCELLTIKLLVVSI
jgi:hypothetical protein